MAWSATIKDPVSAVPDGEYEAIVTAVDTQEALHGTVNKFEFQLSGDGGIEGRKVTGLTSTYIAENTKAGRFVGAIMGRLPSTGENITERDVLGKRCRVVVAQKTDDKGIVRSNVVDVLPYDGEINEELSF